MGFFNKACQIVEAYRCSTSNREKKNSYNCMHNEFQHQTDLRRNDHTCFPRHCSYRANPSQPASSDSGNSLSNRDHIKYTGVCAYE